MKPISLAALALLLAVPLAQAEDPPPSAPTAKKDEKKRKAPRPGRRPAPLPPSATDAPRVGTHAEVEGKEPEQEGKHPQPEADAPKVGTLPARGGTRIPPKRRKTPAPEYGDPPSD